MPIAPQLEDVLEMQATAWQAQSPAVVLPPDLSTADQAVLTLAERMHTALRPMAPRPEFVARLKIQLQATPKNTAPTTSALFTGPWVWLAAGLGGALVGLAALVGWRSWRAQS